MKSNNADGSHQRMDHRHESRRRLLNDGSTTNDVESRSTSIEEGNLEITARRRAFKINSKNLSNNNSKSTVATANTAHTDSSSSSSSSSSSPLPITMEQIDPNERPQRPSVYQRESFLVQFAQTKGPPQIAFLMMLIAIGLGSTIGVVPAVMSDRFARLNHGYSQEMDCSSFDTTTMTDTTTTVKPEACLLGFSDAQTAVSISNLISNALTFLTSSLMGSISDQYGRKYILIAGLSIGMIPPFLLYLIQVVPSLSPWWYYGASASTGIVNWVAIALSSLADVLPQRFRAPGIGLLLAGFMLGFSLAPILALFLSSKHLSLVSFLVILLGWVSTILYVPETLSPQIAHDARRQRQLDAIQTRETFLQQHHATISTLQTTMYWYLLQLRNIFFRPFREMAILNRNHFFRLISSLAFFSGMVSSGDQVLLVYYLEERLAFTAKDVSMMFLIMGVTGLLAQAVFLKPLNDCLGEKNVVALAFLCGSIDNAMYGLAKNKQTIFIALGIAGLCGMAFPTISAIKANNVEKSEQGRIQGALYSLQALASGLGPVSLKYVYNKTKDSLIGPGAMFLFASCLYLCAVGIACSLPKDKANARRSHNNDNSDIFMDESDSNGIVTDEYIQLASDSSSDEDDYGTMVEGNALLSTQGPLMTS